MEFSYRTTYLENSKLIEAIYIKTAQNTRSEAPFAHNKVDHHYICFVKVANHLYELDGDMDGPINRGYLVRDEDVLNKKELNIVRKYIDSEKDGTFCLLAIVEN